MSSDLRGSAESERYMALASMILRISGSSSSGQSGATFSHQFLTMSTTMSAGNSFISICLKRSDSGLSTAMVESYSRRVVAAITRIGARANTSFITSPPTLVPAPNMVTNM